MSTAPILAVEGLSKRFPSRGGGQTVTAVDTVDFAVNPGEIVGLIGESGCGKTTLARTALRLYRPDAGVIRFRGDDVTQRDRRSFLPVRRAVQMVFQDPYGSLNPRMSVGAVIEEPLRIHGLGNSAARRARVADMMQAVGLSPGQANAFPHEFSGGQRQRIGIARALAPQPELIIADEPVSALDVSIRSQILNLMLELKESLGVAYVIITHDLAVVDFMADRVVVMYFGRIVETAPRAALFADPRHPYTRALHDAVLAPEPKSDRRLHALQGEPPNPLAPPAGCPFHPRCPMAEAVCRETRPALEPVAGSPMHLAACHFK